MRDLIMNYQGELKSQAETAYMRLSVAATAPGERVRAILLNDQELERNINNHLKH